MESVWHEVIGVEYRIKNSVYLLAILATQPAFTCSKLTIEAQEQGVSSQ